MVVGNDHYNQVKPDLENAINDVINDAKGIFEAFCDFGLMR